MVNLIFMIKGFLECCPHVGWRTNGDILSMQMAAFRANTGIDCVFIDAPHPAVGPPAEGIAMFYPNRLYCEWVYRDAAGTVDLISLKASEQLVLDALQADTYDGILGFSQGAAMATRILGLLDGTGKLKNLKFAVLVAGVNPIGWEREEVILESIHLFWPEVTAGW
jgi:hypothetical protein